MKCESCGKFFTKKWLTSPFEREHQPNESKPKIDNVNRKIFLPEKQKHDNDPRFLAHENHRHVIIRPSNLGKTYYKLKILEKTGNKTPIYMKTRSPNQYPT